MHDLRQVGFPGNGPSSPEIAVAVPILGGGVHIEQVRPESINHIYSCSRNWRTMLLESISSVRGFVDAVPAVDHLRDDRSKTNLSEFIIRFNQLEHRAFEAPGIRCGIRIA
jgi:hypothetical protein